MVYIVLSSMMIAVTALAVFMPRIPASLFSYCAMWMALAGGVAFFSAETMVFWGVATILTLGINWMLPRHIWRSTVGLPFMAVGGLAGMAVGGLAGMAVGAVLNTMAAIILGTALGCLFGAVAFANTGAGRAVMTFPSKPFFNYLAAKGLPIVVALSMAGAVLVQFVQSQS